MFVHRGWAQGLQLDHREVVPPRLGRHRPAGEGRISGGRIAETKRFGQRLERTFQRSGMRACGEGQPKVDESCVNR